MKEMSNVHELPIAKIIVLIQYPIFEMVQNSENKKVIK